MKFLGTVIRREHVKVDEPLPDAMLAIVNDDSIAVAVCADCHDPHHDNRWCNTCSIRGDAIDEYRDAIRAAYEALRAQLDAQEGGTP